MKVVSERFISRVREHSQGIALEGTRRKDVELYEGKAAKVWAHGPFIVAPVACK